MKLRTVKKIWVTYLVNHVYVGTRAFKRKRNLLRSIGWEIGEGTRIVGPIINTGTVQIGKDCWIGRDFTVNAMAYHPEKGLVDCFGGKNDLQKGILRCVGDPDTRFHEDALRILRAIRFAAVYGLTVEEETARAALRLCPQLSRISAERIGAELTRFLCGAEAPRMIADFWPILSVILPEIGEENWNAVSERMKATEPRLILRLAVLLYPAKEDAQRLLWRLRVAKNTAQQVLSLLQRQDPALPEKAALRLILGQLGEDLTRLRLQLDKALTGDETSFLRQTELLDEILRNGDCCSLSQLAVSGKDLQKRGFWGPQIGQVLQTLLLAVVREEAKNEKTVLVPLAYLYASHEEPLSGGIKNDF